LVLFLTSIVAQTESRTFVWCLLSQLDGDAAHSSIHAFKNIGASCCGS
jgi:hypothetical protein